MRLAEGQRLGHYEIVSLLGSGGMGEVYAAHDTVLRRTVAIKLLHGVAAGHARSRLLREARAASGLSHPSICTIHSVEEADGHAFIVMEHVAGRSLTALIEEGLSPDQVRRYGAQIADAIGTAHASGLVHRDLKSANIIVTPDGRAKVLDFGIATQRPGTEASAMTGTQVTGEAAASGTLAYMAPEVLRGSAADARTDIWALGVVLFEMATRRLPFIGATMFEVSAAILNQPLPALPPSTPRWLASVIGQCLAKEPERRPQSADAVRTALETGQSEFAPVSASRRSARTRNIWMGAAAAVAVIAAVMFGFARRPTPPATSTAIQSVAILPLEDLSGESDQAYFRDGMTEALIATVSRVSGLRVVPRSGVMRYRDAHKPPAEVARDLQVDSVMEGSVLRVGDRVRITATLVHAQTNQTVWTGSYERDLRDVLALQSEVALAIGKELRATGSTAGPAAVGRSPRSVNPQAYDAYLRGLAHINRNNRREYELAIEVLEKAVTLDPAFADAHGALACAYVFLYAAHVPEERTRLEPMATAAIDKALSLDPGAADAYIARGRLLWTPSYGWPHERAIENYRKALQLNPTSDLAHSQLAIAYNHIGFPAMALDELRHSEQVPATLHQMAVAFQVDGKHDQALATWLAIPEPARAPNQKAHIAWVLLDLGRADEAARIFEQLSPADVADPAGTLTAAHALLHAAAGRRKEAEALIAKATVSARTASIEFHHTAYLLAFAYARLGNAGESMRWLRYMAANGFPSYPLVARDRSLDSLRSNPQFVEFLAEIKTRWEGYKARFSE